MPARVTHSESERVASLYKILTKEFLYNIANIHFESTTPTRANVPILTNHFLSPVVWSLVTLVRFIVHSLKTELSISQYSHLVDLASNP